MKPWPSSSSAASTPRRSLSRAAVPSVRPRSRQRSSGQSATAASGAPKRLWWIRSQSAVKSGNRPSVKIFARSASIQAGRVRLMLSRIRRSVRPSVARPHSAVWWAFRYSCRSSVAERRRVPSANCTRLSSTPAPARALGRGRGDDDRDAACERRVADREDALAHPDRRLLRDGVEAEALAKEIEDEALGGGDARAAGGLEAGPERLADAEVAGDLVADLEAGRDAVACLGLLAGVERRDPDDDVGGEQRARDLERGEIEAGVGAGATAAHGPAGHGRLKGAAEGRRGRSRRPA